MVTNRNTDQESQSPSRATMPDCELAELRAAAEAGDERAFSRAVNAIDWRIQSSEDFVKATQLALEAGAFGAARQLSTLGAELHPGEPAIERYRYVLAPPRVVGRRPASGNSVRANRDWLKAHREEYRGQWVGLADGVLLGAALSFEDLVSRIGKPKDVLITKVY